MYTRRSRSAVSNGGRRLVAAASDGARHDESAGNCGGIAIALLGLGAMLEWHAAVERTLGEGIRWVYVHVALVWAGSLALAVAGLADLVVVISGRPGSAGWVQAAWRAGLVAFALGIAFSKAHPAYFRRAAPC